MNKIPETLNQQPLLMPRDVVNGLGTAPRDLLAACLALFDDSTLLSRMDALWDRWLANDKEDDSSEIDEAVSSVQDSVERRKSSEFSAMMHCVSCCGCIYARSFAYRLPHLPRYARQRLRLMIWLPQYIFP